MIFLSISYFFFVDSKYVLCSGCLGISLEFHADRSFIFVLKSPEITYFIGRVVNPQKAVGC